MRKWLEKYWPFVLGIGLPLAIYWTREWVVLDIISEGIMVVDITIATVIFGFLLTMLSIIVQTKNQAVDFMKKHNRFSDVLHLNIVPVAISGIIVILSVVLLAILYKSPHHTFHFFVEFTWLSLNLILALTTFNFVSIFYLIISK